MVHIRTLPVSVYLAVALLFSGCATGPFSYGRSSAKVEDRTPPPPEKTYPVEEVPAPEAKAVPAPETPIPEKHIESSASKPLEQKTGPAVVALLDDADQYTASGKKQQAVASIERALRIEPKNPVLWHKLGKLRLGEGKWEQAIAMAKKSNVLAPGNNTLQSDNWFIIAKAREGMGDKDGALQALDMMQQLRN